MHISLTLAAACTAAVILGSREVRSSAASMSCRELTLADAAQLRALALMLTENSDDGTEFRAYSGWSVTMPADSVTSVATALTCSTAAARYRLARMQQFGASDSVLYPVALVRLGSHGYLGDGLLWSAATGREYVLFDAQLNVRKILRTRR
jgi:hypothetical protein